MDNCILQSRKHFPQRGRMRATGKSFFLLMLLLAMFGTAKADEITIGDLDGAGNNSYLPMNSLYNYSYTQQIYTADEIGMSGTINAITVWLYGNANLYEMPFDIYMLEVDKDAFESNTDWVTVSASDVVYSGSVTVHNTDAEAYTFTLATPFSYSGEGNLLIAFNNTTGQWKSGLNGMVSGVSGDPNRAIYVRQDAAAYDPMNISSYAATSITYWRNVITFDITAGGGGSGELTVHDSDATNGQVPVYGFYSDAYLKCEMVYPAAELSAMTGSNISSMTFYATQESVDWGTNFQVFMTEVSDASISAYVGPDAATVVYEGSLSIADYQMVVTFDTPYTYNGGNLLVGVYQTTQGTYITSTWQGESVEGASVEGYSYSSMAAVSLAQRNFLPKTTFAYGGSGGSSAGPIIVANYESFDLGYRPNGYWMEPFEFIMLNQGTEGTITAITPSDSFFLVDVEVPFVLGPYEGLPGLLTTGSTASTGEINAQLEVQYEGEGLEGTATTYVDITATAYNAVSPDVWELAEEVTDFPFQSTTTTADLYRNYSLPSINPEAKDAVYQVTFTEDVLFSAGTNGANHVAALYPEDFNGGGGPSFDNNYVYNGPEVGPGPMNMWFSYDYTGSNTWYGTSGGGGFYFGYRIPGMKIEELGIAECSLVTVETAARESYPYDLYIFRGGATPFEGDWVYYQAMDYNPESFYFFDVNLNEPVLVGPQDLWIVFYTDSPYAAYCGRTPAVAEFGKIWTYNPNSSSPAWSSNTSYTPVIYCRFLELPTGRQLTVDLGDFSVKSVANPTNEELAQTEGEVKGVSKAEKYNEMQALYGRGNRDHMELTVYDGTTTNSYVPVYGNWGDAYLRCQYVMPADALADMENGEINMMRFYLSSSAAAAWTGTFEVYMTEVDYTEINAFVDPTTATTVYTGTLDASGTEMVVTFDNPYTYNGGNLFIGFDQINPGNYKSASFYGESASGASVQGYSSSSLASVSPTQRNFLPKTTFYYDVVLDPNMPQYQIEDMYVPAGAYYVAVASTDEDFRVDMAIADVPEPEQAVVIAPYNDETNVEYPYLAEWVLGNYTKEMQVLIGMDYPPTTALIDWTDQLVEAAILPELDHNRMYFLQVNERNDTGTTEGEIVSFTTPFDPVTNFTVETPYIYEGDTVVFFWDAIDDDEFLGYRVALSGYGQIHDDLLTETTCSYDQGLAYDMSYGHNFYIEAHYQNGVSPAISQYIYVSGNGTIQGTVYEQDGTTPIAGVTVTFHGYDEFGLEKNFYTVTEETGEYTMDLLAGYYDDIWTSCEGYQNQYREDPLSLAYQEVIEDIDFILDEVFAPVTEVTVNYHPDAENPNAPYVKIDWVNNNRSLNRYRVYRTVYNNDGPFSVYNTELVAEVTGETSTVDEEWDHLDDGLYKYGVSCVYEGNRDAAVSSFEEDFDNGLPAGWSTYDADWDGNNWMRGSEAGLGFGHGHEGSNDMMISQSFQNGSEICPDNYLVTPCVKISQFSEFSFWACPQDANYAAEYFEVLFAPGDVWDVYSFINVAGWSLDNRDIVRGERNTRAQGEWRKFQVDLSQFAGEEGFIAIRHCYNCGNFYLDIDDVVLFDANAQVERESEIVWSDYIGKGMYLGEGEMTATVALNSGDSPAGATISFTNLSEHGYTVDPVTFDETGYYAWDLFRKGEYEVTIAMEGYDTLTAYESIWEPTDLQYMIDEIMVPVTNLNVTPMGYVTWDATEAGGRHFTDNYLVQVLDNSGWYIWNDLFTETEAQIPEDYLSNGRTYTVQVYKEYSSGWYSDPAETDFRYRSCETYKGAKNLYAQVVDSTGIYMSWDYPVFDTTTRANREAWDLVYTFEATSGYQYGVATDGNYIYTSSWSGSSSAMFYKYDMEGNYIEEFDIYGSGQIRDLTYDGQYFYGVANNSTIYCLDFNNYSLVNTIATSYGAMRCCTYDPVRDGFWVVGNWSGNLSFVDRWGNVMFTGPTPTSASGVAYYQDASGTEHVFCFNNNDGQVYDYNISVNAIYGPIFNFANTPGYSGSPGGCHVGNYNGMTCFFGDVQQSPQLIGIYELEGGTPEYHTVIGANIYYNGELVETIGPDQSDYTFEGEEYGQWDLYSLQVLYEDHQHACIQDAYMLSRFEVTVNEMEDVWALHMSPYGSYWNHPEGGTVEGTGEFLELDTCTLIAVPDEGYEFYYWMNLSNNQRYYTDTLNIIVNASNTMFEINFKTYEQPIEVVPGWNWWSTYIEQENYNGYEQLSNVMNVSGSMIVSQTAFSQSYGDYGWYGSLSELNNESMYKLKWIGEQDTSAVMMGCHAKMAEHPITLNNGWNWIGYPSNSSADLNFAFFNLEPSDGDMVKSQFAYANYYDGYGWFGSLNTIDPGMGLMYKSMSDTAVTFTYYEYRGEEDLRENLRGNHWTVNHNDYSNNMTMMAVVELNNEELKSNQYELAAFSNGVCRGSIELLYVEPMDRYVAFMTISGEGGEELTFGLYDAVTGEERFDAVTSVTFLADAMVGSFDNPFVVRFRGTTGLDELDASMQLYPNPVAQGEKISIDLSVKPVRVEILNALGETVVVENQLQHPIHITAPNAPGVYTVRVITENKGVISHKIIVK